MARTQQTRKGKAAAKDKDPKNKKRKDEEESEEEEEEEEVKTTAKNGKGKKGAAKDAGKKAQPKGKGKGKAKEESEDEEEEEEEEEEKKPARGKRGAKAADKPEKTKAETKSASKAKGKAKKNADKDEEEEEKDDKKKDDEKEEEKDDKDGKRSRGKDQDEEAEADAKDNRIVRKKTKLDLDNIEVHVDEYFPKKNDVQVYIKGEEIYDAKLNQSNVQDNNNKFYVIQVLQDKAKTDSFYCYTRWGRVGVKGQDKSMGPTTEEKAIDEYNKKLKEKTKKGEYRLLDMDYTKDTTKDAAQAMEDGLKTSALKKPVADFISLIFDLKMATQQMEQSGYDANKLPLGKLSKHNIQKGYSILKELLEAIKDKKGDSELVRLTNDFYSFIPHNVGFSKMKDFKITDEETVKKKLDLLDSLSNIKTTYELIEQKGDVDNVIDANFKKLKCEIEPLEKDSKEYKMVEKYVDNTKEGARVQIVNMFKIQREGEQERYTKDLENKTLLWHGSRLANYVGIISQGLRIAPPEAPVSGYRFGKGIYLADMFSKSHGYCAAWGSSGTFCIMVCEGALGTPNELLHDNFNASTLPTGKHSTKALGHVAPPKSSYEEVEPGVVIPLGKPEKTEHQNSSCYHNEFIIYDVKQVRIRYLIWMKNA